MIVEDEYIIASGLAYLLENEAWETTLAPNLAKAREAIKQQKPDVVLLDLMLPDGIGVSLFEDLMRCGVEASRVVVITGMTDRNTLHQLAARQPLAVLQKPVRPQELLDIINGS